MKSLLSALALGVTLPLTLSFAIPTSETSLNTFVREPLVLFDSANANFPGLLETSLVAYNDGRVVYTTNSFPFSPNGDTIFVTTELDTSIVQQLLSDILAIGAIHLEDSTLLGPGTSTITILKPASGRSHTFSYSGLGFPQNQVEGIINNFIALHLIP